MRISSKQATLLAASLILLRGATVFAAEPQTAKKVIEWGWDEPDTKFMRENIERMEKWPFEGLVFHANNDKGAPLMWETFGGPPYKIEDFRQAIDDLKATKFQRFTDRFLRVNVTPGKIDWFEEKDWAPVLNNCGISAQIAREGRCKGFMFDTEQYEMVTLFDYSKQPHRDTKSFADYQAKVRERGREWIEGVNRQFPDIVILLTFGYKTARLKSSDLSREEYGLLAAFLDGMLDGCSATTRIVDAWEFSYGYKQPEQYRDAYRTIREEAVSWTGSPDKYRRHVTAGFGIWLDNSQKKGWHPDDFSKNYFSPEEFERSLKAALKTTDEYVWIYSEKPRWWTNEQLPQAYMMRSTASASSGR